MTSSTIFELRVLAGPQAGAAIVVKPNVDVGIGSLSSQNCQVVLRDPSVDWHRLHVRLRDGAVRLHVVRGQVNVDGQVLTGPCSADWPLYAPLRLGDTVIAIGVRGAEAWGQAHEQAQRLPALLLQRVSPEGMDTATGDVSADEAVVDVRPRRRPEAWVATVGGVVAVVGAGLLSMVALGTSAQHGEPTERERLSRLLTREEFKSLRAEVTKEGEIRVLGVLPSRASRAKLEQALAAETLGPTLDVRVEDDVATAVAEVFRMNGVVAEVTAANGAAGTVRVRTVEPDVARLKRAEAAVRRDVPGLASLQLEHVPLRLPPPPMNIPDDPQKRVAAVVAGEVPYLVTADGSRYFIGAMLPSGHRVDAITDQQVLLTKDGMTSPLRF